MLILFAGLKSISRCSKLSSLKLGICLNISDEGLSHVGMKCSKLTELDLYRYLVATPDLVLVNGI
jgi:F-box/leucine-rich repeat protein 2/20